MKRLIVAMAQALVVALFFATSSFADDEEALKKDLNGERTRGMRPGRGGAAGGCEITRTDCRFFQTAHNNMRGARRL